MYLRVGWVVGNVGLMGGLLVILAATSLTFATGLSIASIATNTRLDAGGPYSMISRSLGVEVGGAIGLPLFLSQTFAVAMYIFGFREGWLTLFPNHSALVVDLFVFGVIFGTAYISAGLAFRLQYLVMGLVGLSLLSILGNIDVWQSDLPIEWWGRSTEVAVQDWDGTSWWGVFAIFFPATTGIMSGLNMSGELKNSRRSIPRGTLSAIALSTAIYLMLCVWTSRAAEPSELVRNYTIMVDRALWQPAVLGGLIAATFSAALSSLVGAPRILVALSRDGVLPRGQFLSILSPNGEPRRALAVSGVIVVLALLIRDINVIAPFITMFFLITYATLNFVILLESSLGLMNFRPTLKVPRVIPLYGLVGCLLSMYIINPFASFFAVLVVVVIYLRLVADPRPTRYQTVVRSGIFAAIAQWAATTVVELDMNYVRAWKPTVMVPVEDSSELLGEFRLLLDLCTPEGIVILLGIRHSKTVQFGHRLEDISIALRRRKIFSSSSVLEANTVTEGIIAALQISQSAFFRPNILFVNAPKSADQWTAFMAIFTEAQRFNVGVVLFGAHPTAGLGRAEVINLWITPQLEESSMDQKLAKGSLNLALLLSLRLLRTWKGQLNLIAVVEHADEKPIAQQYIEELSDLCRVPKGAQTLVLQGDFLNVISQAPQSDMDFVGLPQQPQFDFIQQIIQQTGSSCLFIRDSGSESALA